MAVKVVLNRQAVRQLLRSEDMMRVCREQAEAIQQRAGDGYALSEYTGKNRVNVSIRTETAEAALDNNRNNTLLRALK